MYKIVEKIGRAGGAANRAKKAKEWDEKYGTGKWKVVYQYNDRIYTREEALEEFYNRSYYEFLKRNPSLVEELCSLAKEIYNPHAVETGSIDLQCPAVLKALDKLGLSLKGTEKVAIGVWGAKFGRKYPSISYKLSPFKVPLWCQPTISVEAFWQDYKYLAIEL